MRLYILLVLILFGGKNIAQNCEDLEKGTFEYNSNGIKVQAEFTKGWQLEKNQLYGVVFLNRLYKIEDCKYRIDTYKLIQNDLGMEPNLNSSAELTILKIIDNKYYYEFKIKESGQMTKGIYIKVSDEISDEFKEIIKKEKRNK